MKKNKREEVIRWLTQAVDELRDAADLKHRKRYYLALFHFQEAAEKALKAYLYQITSSEESFFTHSIYELIEALSEHDPDFIKLKPSAKLDEYYIPTRYPNGLPGGVPSRFFRDDTEAQQAMDLAQSVIDTVKTKTGIANLD